MNDEFNALMTNKTRILAPCHVGPNIVNYIWLFKKKQYIDGSLARYKAQLVANCRSQRPGVDCDETFSPMDKPTMIHTVLTLVVSHNCPIRKFDVKNDFLHGEFLETVYMHQPPSFQDPHHLDHVCLLQDLFIVSNMNHKYGFIGLLISSANLGLIEIVMTILCLLSDKDPTLHSYYYIWMT